MRNIEADVAGCAEAPTHLESVKVSLMTRRRQERPGTAALRAPPSRRSHRRSGAEAPRPPDSLAVLRTSEGSAPGRVAGRHRTSEKLLYAQLPLSSPLEEHLLDTPSCFGVVPQPCCYLKLRQKSQKAPPPKLGMYRRSLLEQRTGIEAGGVR